MQFYNEYQKRVEENPLYQVCNELVEEYRCSLDELLLDSLFDTISLPEFVQFIVFESVAERIRQQLHDNETRSLYSYAYTNEDRISQWKDLQLRKEFIEASVHRNNVQYDSEKLKWAQPMKDRADYRHGVLITPLQHKQLQDKNDLKIGRIHQFRRLSDSKHVNNQMVQDFYNDLVEHAKKRQAETDTKSRVLNAINLNDDENNNLYFFLYDVASYCVEHRVSRLTDNDIHNLILLSGSLQIGDNIHITHKPILYTSRYIPLAFSSSKTSLNCYINLALTGLILRKKYLSEALDSINCSYDEIDFFINGSGLYSYNIFRRYTDFAWSNDEKTNKKIIAMLRSLISQLTVDPLSR